MGLAEAIEHLNDILNNRKWKCEECRKEHEQLRDWLLELLHIKEGNKMIKTNPDVIKKG